MGKSSGKSKSSSISVPKPESKRQLPWFGLSIVVVLITGAVAMVILASQRVSTADIAPRALVDHWHNSFNVYACDTFLPPNQSPDHGDGIHGHADGLIHIHPANSRASGPKATLGEYLETVGATITDSSYLPGPGEGSLALDESVGCNGQPAQLTLAVWPFEDLEADPKIVTENIADYLFQRDGEVITLALLPPGQEVPQNPLAGNIADPGDQ